MYAKVKAYSTNVKIGYRKKTIYMIFHNFLKFKDVIGFIYFLLENKAF